MCSRRANPGTILLGLLISANYFYQCNCTNIWMCVPPQYHSPEASEEILTKLKKLFQISMADVGPCSLPQSKYNRATHHYENLAMEYGESHRFCGQRSIVEGQIEFNSINNGYFLNLYLNFILCILGLILSLALGNLT